jgi:tRNA pseudouridine55 synthase
MGRRPKINYAEEQPNAILLVDKPQGWTSHDVVNVVRNRFRQKKVGHCGTLDPMATGLLILVLGKCTKLSQHFSSDSKSYVGQVTLGTATNTLDAEGEVTETASYEQFTKEQIDQMAEKFRGEIMQTPPMVSALKKNGQTLHKLARAGKVVERDPRPITIHELRVESVDLPNFTIYVNCSKGTYIRSIADDMGRELDTVGHLSALRRVTSGEFSVTDAPTADDIKEWEIEDLLKHITPIDINEYQL